MLKNSVSRFITMNVFGSSQSGDTKNIITNIEQSFKAYTYKFDKIEHLLEENNKSIHAQEEQIKSSQIMCVKIVESLSKIEASLQIKCVNIVETLSKIEALLQIKCVNIVESLSKIEASLTIIKENTE